MMFWANKQRVILERKWAENRASELNLAYARRLGGVYYVCRMGGEFSTHRDLMRLERDGKTSDPNCTWSQVDPLPGFAP